MSALRWHASLQDGDALMADLDLVEDLEAERAKLEKLDAELRARVSAEVAPVVEDDKLFENSWYNSRIAESIGYQAGQTIGEVLVELFRGLVPSGRNRSCSRSSRCRRHSSHRAGGHRCSRSSDTDLSR